MTEIFLERDITDPEIVINNYAIEIFNPTADTIDLSDYALVLANQVYNDTIFLSGVILPKDVVVVADNQSDLGLQAAADLIVQGLNVDEYCNVSLLKNESTIIDKFGYANNTVGQFDQGAFLADLAGYLASYNIDINDFVNIDLRRGLFVTKGDPTFSYGSTSFFGQWSIHTSVDRNHLGEYIGTCNKPTGKYLAGLTGYTTDDTYYMRTRLCRGCYRNWCTRFTRLLFNNEIFL